MADAWYYSMRLLQILCTMPLCSLLNRVLCRRPVSSKGHDISMLIKSAKSISSKSFTPVGWIIFIFFNSKSIQLTIQGLEFLGQGLLNVLHFDHEFCEIPLRLPFACILLPFCHSAPLFSVRCLRPSYNVFVRMDNVSRRK